MTKKKTRTKKNNGGMKRGGKEANRDYEIQTINWGSPGRTMATRGGDQKPGVEQKV